MIPDLVGITMIAMTLAIIGLMIRDDTRGNRDLINTRNLFLIGFIIFQLTSISFTAFSRLYAPYFLSNETSTLILYTLLTGGFLAIFWIAYARGWGLGWMSKLRKHAPPQPQVGKLLALSVLMTVTAVGLRFGVNVPLVGQLSFYTGTSVAAAACGIVGWVWIRQPLNPVLAFYGLAVIGANLFVTIYGQSSRRYLLAIFACVIWSMYFSRLRYYPKRKYIPTLLIFFAASTAVLALFTSVRDPGDRGRSAAAHVQAMLTEGSITRGLAQIGPGQQTGGVSLWLIEQYPDQFEYRGPLTLGNVIFTAVPRTLWPDKPDPLSQEIPHMAKLRNVSRDKLTIGPGIIGQSWSDFGTAAVLLYALIYATLFRFVDNIIFTRINDPVVVISLGSALSQVIAIPRGDVSLFTFTYIYTTFSTFLVFAGIAYLFRFQRVGNRESPMDIYHDTDESIATATHFRDAYFDDAQQPQSRKDTFGTTPTVMPNYAET